LSQEVHQTLQLATKNSNKVREVVRYLSKLEVVGLPDTVTLPPETGLTYAENALGKARAASLATGLTTIADDSGIESEYLKGAPGVRSARFASESATDAENLSKLMAEVPAGTGLRYVCAVAYVDPAKGCEKIFEGICNGFMANGPKGENGFGYDPVFIAKDYADEGLTVAQLTAEQKDQISHRGAALRKLSSWLAAR